MVIFASGRPFRRKSNGYGDVVFGRVYETLVLVGVGIWSIFVA